MIVSRRAARAMDAPTLYAFTAGQYRGMRDAWLAEVRRNEFPDLREVKITFAKNAHRAYLNSLRQSLKLQKARA